MIDVRMMARKLLLGGAYWSGAAAVAAPFLAGNGAILMLHRVTRRHCSPLGVNDHLAITPDFLDVLLTDLKARDQKFVSMDELLDALSKGKSRNLIAITADDGWRDNITEALPVFEAHDAPFCIYVAPGLTDGSIAPWWEIVEEYVAQRDSVEFPSTSGPVRMLCPDRRSKRAATDRLVTHLTTKVPELEQQDFLRDIGAFNSRSYKPADRFMSWSDVRAVTRHRLGTVGAHTVHHYNLKRLESDDVVREMTESAAIIRSETGQKPRHFAYPYGSRSAAGRREVTMALRAGFASAVTTRHGVLHSGHADNLHALPRISVNGYYQQLPYMRALLSGLITPLANGGRRLVTI